MKWHDSNEQDESNGERDVSQNGLVSFDNLNMVRCSSKDGNVEDISCFKKIVVEGVVYSTIQPGHNCKAIRLPRG